MELVVDLTTGDVTLDGRDDLDRLSVQVIPEEPGDRPDNGGLGALAAALSVHGAGTVDPEGHVFIPIGEIRRLAGADQAPSVDDGWDNRFATMIEYATTHGWVTDDGAVRAHVEWRE